jgi:hypothetical protein
VRFAQLRRGVRVRTSTDADVDVTLTLERPRNGGRLAQRAARLRSGKKTLRLRAARASLVPKRAMTLTLRITVEDPEGGTSSKQLRIRVRA